VADNDATFDPSKHVIKLRGKGGGSADYLPVDARIKWFRDAHPDGVIETDHVMLDERIAVFRAVIRATPHEGVAGRATGYGSETPNDFKDYIEKAETKAIGRALAALGYGTQFVEGDGAEPLADSPVERPPAKPVKQAPRQNVAPDVGPPPVRQGSMSELEMLAAGYRERLEAARTREEVAAVADDIAGSGLAKGPERDALVDVYTRRLKAFAAAS
jgi:hypothetical protein